MKKFTFGTCLGIGSIFILPESEYQKVSSYIQVFNDRYSKTKAFLSYYSPSEVNKRKSEEIKAGKKYQHVVLFDFEEEKNDRKNVAFYTDLQERMRIADLVANQRGVTKQEKINVIEQTLKDHYPEMFTNYKDIIASKLEKQIRKPGNK